MKTVLLVTVAALALSSSAFAQGRPGSSPAGGRIGVLCNNELFDQAFRTFCFEEMKGAKTSSERAEITKVIKAKAKELQAARQEQLRKDGNLAERAQHEFQSQR